MAEAFIKSGVIQACPFMFKYKILNADWKFCGRGRVLLTIGVHCRMIGRRGLHIWGPSIFSIFHQEKKVSVSPEKNFLACRYEQG